MEPILIFMGPPMYFAQISETIMTRESRIPNRRWGKALDPSDLDSIHATSTHCARDSMMFRRRTAGG